MLDRMAGVLARLRTFELIEGGRRPVVSVSTPTSIGGATPVASTPLLPLGGTVTRPGDDGGNDDGNIAGGIGGGDGAVAHGKENKAEGGEANQDDGIGSCSSAESGEDGDADSNGAATAHDDNDDDMATDTAVISGVNDKNGGGGEQQGSHGGGAVLSEVARWLQFRTADLVSFVGGALQAGDVQAASVAWRRHGRTDRGAARAAKAAAAATAVSTGAGGAGAIGEGRRMEVALPGQLATLPAVAPPVLLGAWLRDEVLPCLDVAGVMAVSLVLWW